jgi:chloride channel protein, CIC family
MTHSRRLLIDSLLLGVVGALSAQLFLLLLRISYYFFIVWIAGYAPPELPAEGGVLVQHIGPHGLWLIPVVTTLGGLISGILVYIIAPEAEGDGTDNAVKSYHWAGGYIRSRVPPLKLVASAITIGSGGAAGREGPISQVSAGFGAAYADLTNRSEDDRRLLLLIGMAAGLSAIFRSPIGCAIFAVEVLYSEMEFEAAALYYTLLASVVAYVVNGLFVGWHPLFKVPSNVGITGVKDFGYYVVLGVASGLVATLLPIMFYGIRDGFRLLRIPAYVKPAIGGLAVGLIALKLPQVLGGGYGWMQMAIDGHLPMLLLFSLVFAKMVAFCLTVSSGGSGGSFAPSLFVGAMLGGFVAHVFGQPAAGFVVVGIVAMFGAAARVPFATLLMVVEMTGGYEVLVPAATAVAISYFVQTLLSSKVKYKSLYAAQLMTRSDSPAHHVEIVGVVCRLLRDKQVPCDTQLDHVNLVDLLESSIPVDLPDGKQLEIVEVKGESSCVGMTPRSVRAVEAGKDAVVTAVIRQGEVISPHSETVLREGDQLVVLVMPLIECPIPESEPPKTK